ncbi:MAG TPA: hypothetical protein VGZ00_01930 [Candidatus Baltobacteraceae bacterium]|nr:hypothetical protein [Candidatus Baltobacteraceae bacterium]
MKPRSRPQRAHRVRELATKTAIWVFLVLFTLSVVGGLTIMNFQR